MIRSLIYRATISDASTSISEYQINQIVQVTFDPDPSVNAQLVSIVAHRLNKADLCIKTRCCKLVKHLCERGKPDFRRIAQRELADSLRLLTTYNAPPHATRGQEPLRQLRQSALEALSALFAQDNSTSMLAETAGISGSPTAAMSRGAMDRFELSVSGGYQGDVDPGPCVSSGRMEGFGNVDYAESTGSGVLRTILDSVTSKLASLSPSMKWTGWPSAQGRPGDTDLCTYCDNPNANAWNRPVYVSPLRTTTVPPESNWQLQSPQNRSHDLDSFNLRQDRQIDSRQKLGSSPNRFSVMRQADSIPTPSVPSSADITSGEPGDFEVLLVERITEPGGARLTPPVKALDEFRRKCETLDLSVVLVTLFGKLDDDHVQWQQRLRCLCVLEALLKPRDRLSQITQKFVTDNSDACLRGIRALEHIHTCRLTAKDVLSLLECNASRHSPLFASGETQGVSLSAEMKRNSEPVSLLDLEDDHGDDNRQTSQSEHPQKEDTNAEDVDSYSSVAADQDEVGTGEAQLDTGTAVTQSLLDLEPHSAPPPSLVTSFPFVFQTAGKADSKASSLNKLEQLNLL